jgi:hypothetical protein
VTQWYSKTVTDGERGECVDPGENGAILDAGAGGGPGQPGGGKSGQLASDSGGGKTLQDVGRHRRRARHNIKPWLCTEYVSYVYYVYQLIML